MREKCHANGKVFYFRHCVRPARFLKGVITMDKQAIFDMKVSDLLGRECAFTDWPSRRRNNKKDA